MWPPKAALLAKLKPGLTSMRLESISFSFSEKLIQKFLPVEKRDDTLFRAPGETIACEHLNEATA